MLPPALPRSRPRGAGPAPGRDGTPAAARAAVVLLAGLPVLVGTPGTASAHTALASSTPATGSALETPTAEVTLVFTEAVSADLADVVVTAPDGGDSTRGAARVDGATVTQPLAGAGVPGAYRVAYRVVAADGHPVTGTFEYTVTAGTPAPADSAPAGGGPPVVDATEDASTAGGPSGSPDVTPTTDPGGGRWLLPVGAVALAVAGLGLVAARARSGRPR